MGTKSQIPLNNHATPEDRADAGKFYAISRQYERALDRMGLSMIAKAVARTFEVGREPGEPIHMDSELAHEVATCLGKIAYYCDRTSALRAMPVVVHAMKGSRALGMTSNLAIAIGEVAERTRSGESVIRVSNMLSESPCGEWSKAISNIMALLSKDGSARDRAAVLNAAMGSVRLIGGDMSAAVTSFAASAVYSGGHASFTVTEHALEVLRNVSEGGNVPKAASSILSIVRGNPKALAELASVTSRLKPKEAYDVVREYSLKGHARKDRRGDQTE